MTKLQLSGSKEEKIEMIVAHYSAMAKKNENSDRVMLRKAINVARKSVRKNPLEKISQSQFRRIYLKYERAIKHNKRRECIYAAILSGMNKSKAADS
jgi:hypothetical protein